MGRNRKPGTPDRGRSDLDEALEAMGPGELREVLREILSELDDRAYGRVVASLIERAARGASGWAPAAPDPDDVEEVVAFAEAAEAAGYAAPGDVDDRLRRGVAAFLGKDYAAAHRMLGALLRPIAAGEVDLGEHEMVDEVLGVDPSVCATRYVVSAYMISPPGQRARAVREAIAEMWSVGYFLEPIRDMERVAVEPLPDLDRFMPQWRELLEKEAAGERRRDWDRYADRWLRQVTRRLEGAEGLARIARSTRRADDLRAWCRSLVEAGDWKAALAAFEEAAQIVTDKEYARAELLDGAALAAQELGRKDLSLWLERAWRATPSMLRLRRWLGAAPGKATLRKRAAEALAACPPRARRQRAFLHLLQGDFPPAARLLAEAPGLGWSAGEHPGHLLFPLLQELLGGEPGPPGSDTRWGLRKGPDLDELALLASADEAPRLAAPESGELLRQAGIVVIPDGEARAVVLSSMREAAERRVEGVTREKRRRDYGHAAELVAACLACDRSPEALRWAASFHAKYRRFRAFRAELDRRLGPR